MKYCPQPKKCVRSNAVINSVRSSTQPNVTTGPQQPVCQFCHSITTVALNNYNINIDDINASHAKNKETNATITIWPRPPCSNIPWREKKTTDIWSGDRHEPQSLISAWGRWKSSRTSGVVGRSCHMIIVVFVCCVYNVRDCCDAVALGWVKIKSGWCVSTVAHGYIKSSSRS